MYKDWERTYESLSPMVVPRSTEMIHEDSEYGLYTVTVFKKVIDEFKLHARESKWVWVWPGGNWEYWLFRMTKKLVLQHSFGVLIHTFANCLPIHQTVSDEYGKVSKLRNNKNIF